MSACGCPGCSANPPPTYTEKYRHECEMRVVAAMSHARRITYINGVRDKRGPEAAKALERMQGGLF